MGEADGRTKEPAATDVADSPRTGLRVAVGPMNAEGRAPKEVLVLDLAVCSPDPGSPRRPPTNETTCPRALASVVVPNIGCAQQIRPEHDKKDRTRCEEDGLHTESRTCSLRYDNPPIAGPPRIVAQRSRALATLPRGWFAEYNESRPIATTARSISLCR